MSEQLRVAISGAGAMGCLFGGLLAEGGAEVHLIDVNAEHVSAINTNGLHMVGHGGDRTIKVSATSDPSSLPDVDVVFFQCKAMHSHDAANAAKVLFDRNSECIAVSFQNGLGNEENIAQVLGDKQVLAGLTVQGASLDALGVVRNYAMLPSHIGELAGSQSKRAIQLAMRIDGHGLPCNAVENIRKEMWKKLLANIGFSASSGTTNLNVDQLLAIPELAAAAKAALREALAVAQAVGIVIDDNEAFALAEQISGSRGTGGNKSSLCVDINNKRSTEVDYIYGPVIAAGREHNIATPVLDTLSAIVKGQESHYLKSK